MLSTVTKYNHVTEYQLLVGIKISVFIPFANIAKISSMLKFVDLQYIYLMTFSTGFNTLTLSKIIGSYISGTKIICTKHNPYLLKILVRIEGVSSTSAKY